MRWKAFLGLMLLTLSCADARGPSVGDSVDELLGWMTTHPENVSVVVLDAAAGDVLVEHDPHAARPLASVRKVLILGAYAEAVAAGDVAPDEAVDLEDVERWWLVEADGGAHEQAVDEATAKGWLRDGELELDRVVWAMVRWSDNAAADYLLARLGERRVQTFAKAHDVETATPLTSIFGEMLAWSDVPVDDWEAMTPAERHDHSTRTAEQPVGPVRGIELPDATEQRRLAATSMTGTAHEWADLMASIATAKGWDPQALAIVREHLEWPLQAFPEQRERFEAFGTKGGSLPGVLTEASYLQAPAGDPVAVALFFHDLDLDDWKDLSGSFVHQQLLLQLVDADVRDRLADALGDGSSR